MGKHSIEHNVITYLSGIKVYSTMGGVQASAQQNRNKSVEPNARMFNSTGIASIGNSGALDIGSGSAASSSGRSFSVGSGTAVGHGSGGIDIPAKMARLHA